MHWKLISASLAALTMSTSALAVESIGGGGCASDLTLGAGSSLVSCYGRFSGNVLNNSDNDQINTALDALGYAGADISYNLVPLSNILSVGTDPGAQIDFSGLLNGLVYIGIHTGGGGRNGVGNQTSFYKISALNLDVITLNPSGGSTATLFVSSGAAVPEPATWAMMLLGFGFVGAAMRRKQSQTVKYSLS